MANYLSDRTGASIDEVLDNADAGNIGKSSSGGVSDWNLIDKNGFFDAATNSPTGGSAYGFHAQPGNQSFATQFIGRASSFFARSKELGTWSDYELYHTGNTGFTEYGNGPLTPGTSKVRFRTDTNTTEFGAPSTGAFFLQGFINSNGTVGSISVSGTSTAFNTSSDPRLKDFAEAPTDEAINEEFNKMFSCFRTFKWKTDPEGELVWGFDAHACIDAGTGIGSEGEGPRDSELGEVYETTPAVTESRVVMDSEGNPTSETEEVVITEAVDKKVSPAGVDQSKAVPILLAKIEQLERRLSAANL